MRRVREALDAGLALSERVAASPIGRGTKGRAGTHADGHYRDRSRLICPASPGDHDASCHCPRRSPAHREWRLLPGRGCPGRQALPSADASLSARHERPPRSRATDDPTDAAWLIRGAIPQEWGFRTVRSDPRSAAGRQRRRYAGVPAPLSRAGAGRAARSMEQDPVWAGTVPVVECASVWTGTLASPAGFEPATFRLEGGCSVH